MIVEVVLPAGWHHCSTIEGTDGIRINEERMITKMKATIAILTIIIIAASSGCYYDKKELVAPATTCDTANMTYTGNIESIIQARCYSCHQGSSSISGFPLDSYDNLKEHVDDGDVVRLITSTDPSEMMPQGGPRLPDCEIAKIVAWVNAGAPR